VRGITNCSVPEARVLAALDSLTRLSTTPSPKSLSPGNFKLSIHGTVGGVPLFHMDVGDQVDEGHIVQLGDMTRHHVRGLDLGALSASIVSWCGKPQP
jgi:hypothetical protein